MGIIKNNIRIVDCAGRYGGEEFCIILPDTIVENARVVAERLRQKIERGFINTGNDTLSATVSIGLAGYNSKKMFNVQDFIHSVDKALYLAKKRGRNRIEIFK